MASIDLYYFAGQFEIVKLLVERGAAVDVRNRFGKTPLYIAVEYAMRRNIFANLLVKNHSVIEFVYRW